MQFQMVLTGEEKDEMFITLSDRTICFAFFANLKKSHSAVEKYANQFIFNFDWYKFDCSSPSAETSSNSSGLLPSKGEDSGSDSDSDTASLMPANVLLKSNIHSSRIEVEYTFKKEVDVALINQIFENLSAPGISRFVNSDFLRRNQDECLQVYRQEQRNKSSEEKEGPNLIHIIQQNVSVQQTSAPILISKNPLKKRKPTLETVFIDRLNESKTKSSERNKYFLRVETKNLHSADIAQTKGPKRAPHSSSSFFTNIKAKKSLKQAVHSAPVKGLRQS